MRTLATIFFLCCMGALRLVSQEHQHTAAHPSVPLQPLAQQARQMAETLNYLGQPLTPAEQKRINDAIAVTDETAAVEALQKVLDSHVLVNIDINPESRVKVEQGEAKPELVEQGTRLFLVKVNNLGHVTAELNVASPNSGNVFIKSNGQP